VRCSKTGVAYDRLIRGETDIIFVARPSKAHLEQALQMNVELHLTPIGREAFVFFVNERNPVQGLTIDQILDVYSGEITHWHALGGQTSGSVHSSVPRTAVARPCCSISWGGGP